MTHKPVESHADGFYKVPELQPSLFGGMEGTRFMEDELKGVARKVGREQRFDLLFKALSRNHGLKDRTMRILERVEGDEEAFRVALDSLAYARRRDDDQSRFGRFEYTVQRLEKCIQDGSLPLRKMKELLEVGLPFDSVTHHASEDFLQMERNWVRGGERTLDDRIDLDFPPVEGIKAELEGMQVYSVHVGSENVPLDQAGERVLRGVYASRIRSRRALDRKKQRFLNTEDW